MTSRDVTLTRRTPATIREVADRAGVSQMTVSRVMNSPDRVKTATRERVRQAMADLGYRPNLLARNLAGGRSLFIGLIYDNPSPGYLTELLLGALRACEAHGHHLVLQDIGAEAEGYVDPVALAQRVSERPIDAIIVAPPLSEDPDVRAVLVGSGLPCVLVAPPETSADEAAVAIDDEAAAAAMTAHLAGCGHERIAFIAAPEEHRTGRRRTDGYRRALAEAGLAVPDGYVERGAFTYRSGMEAAARLLALPVPPTAIFAANDDMAAGALAAAHQAGLTVPTDLSVAGFDDTGMATTVWPQLTTVRQPIADMAARAVALLGERWREAGGGAPHERFAFAIVERDSVASLTPVMPDERVSAAPR